VTWLDESRRAAFNLHFGTDRQNNRARAIEDLTQALPEDLRQRSLATGNELILPYEDTLTAIAIANERDIAILGFEAGEVLDSGFQVLDYNGYDFKFSGDWKAYVQANNAAAEQWVREHRFGKNHGYVVTSTSEREFAELLQRKN
jgi:hypothetical protein